MIGDVPESFHERTDFFRFGYNSGERLPFLQPSNYLEQIFLFVFSTVMIGFGMFLEVKANVLMVAGEGVVKAIATVTKKDFGKIKIISDCVLVTISLSLGLVYANKIIGIREGTVLAAIFVGLIVKYLNRHVQFIDHFLEIRIAGKKV
ncbi:MAG: DUF6198 family protein [Desulfopila sp.]